MDFNVRVLKADLKAGFDYVSQAVGNGKDGKAILTTVLFEAVEQRGKQALKLRATDGDMEIISWVRAEVKQTGTIAVPAKLFGGYIASIPADQWIDLTQEGEAPLICKSRGKERIDSSINPLDANSFPAEAKLVMGHKVVVSAKELKKSLAQVDYCASNDDSKPALQGIMVNFTSEGGTLAGCDTIKLSEKNLSVLEAAPSASVDAILPASSLIRLQSILPDKDDVKVEIGPNSQGSLTVFKIDGLTSIGVTNIAAKYPNYAPMLSNKWTLRIAMETARLNSALRSAVAFAKAGGRNGILLTVEQDEEASEELKDTNQLHLFAVAEQEGEFSRWLPIYDLQGEADLDYVDIYVNVKALEAHIASITTPYVVLEYAAYNKPILVKQMDEDGVVLDDLTMLLMPLSDKELTAKYSEAA